MWWWILGCGHRPPIAETRWPTPHGDLVMACALDTCNLALDGAGRPVPLAQDLWIPTEVSGSLRQPQEGVWLLRTTEGDACPSRYRLVCPAVPDVSRPFGNCGELSNGIDGAKPLVRFDADRDANRHAMVFQLDPEACAAREVPAGD